VQKANEAFALPISEAAPIDGSADMHALPAGFRHFLGTPKASQRFKAYGIDSLDAPGHSEKLRKLMNRLSRRMDAAIPWPAHRDATIERWENPGIPSGYTYLLQFVAHDLVHSAIPLSVTGTLGADTANARRAALKLETLFGSGPVGSPFVYARIRQTTNGAPNYGLAACAGRTRRSNPAARSATSHGRRPRTSPG
jgi:hypothetical protein